MTHAFTIAPKMIIKYCEWRKQWCVIDKGDNYVVSTCSTPAVARQLRRRWFLFYTLEDEIRAWEVLNGTVDVK